MGMKDIFGRPAAQRRLVICIGQCCNKAGDAEALLGGLSSVLRLSGMDEAMAGRASCLRKSCLGKCTGEPLAVIEPDGICYHHLSIENLIHILRDHVLGERPVSELILSDWN